MISGQPLHNYIDTIDDATLARMPILDIAARCWDKDRYDAFRVCYKSMRWIDDLVDREKSETPGLISSKIRQIERTIFSWIEAILTRNFFESGQKELSDVLTEYRIPLDPWKRFLKAMLYDLQHNGFRNMLTFLRYCDGAAIAPASIFMHLCGIKKDEGRYHPPDYDATQAARPLALFSYLVHIVRDFQKDHLENLNYFPDHMVKRHGLTVDEIRSIAEGGPVSQAFRNLISDYVNMADYYRKSALEVLDKILPNMKENYRMSLEVIYQLYYQIFEKIDPARGTFTREELNTSPLEIRSRLNTIFERYAVSAV